MSVSPTICMLLVFYSYSNNNLFSEANVSLKTSTVQHKLNYNATSTPISININSTLCLEFLTATSFNVKNSNQHIQLSISNTKSNHQHLPNISHRHLIPTYLIDTQQQPTQSALINNHSTHDHSQQQHST